MAKSKRRALPEERLSPSEWEIMRICWRLGRCNARQVLREDLKHRVRDYRTILTFLTRMAKKGWLEVEKKGNTNYYLAAVEQNDALSLEIQRFLDDVIGPDAENLTLLETAVQKRLD